MWDFLITKALTFNGECSLNAVQFFDSSFKYSQMEKDFNIYHFKVSNAKNSL